MQSEDISLPKNNKDLTLDYYKLLLSFLVVCLHVFAYMGPIEKYNIIEWFFCNGITRIAVPSFFIINGYFLFPKIENFSKVLSYVKHLFILYFVWTLIYLYFEGDNSFISMLYRISTGYIHLWYIWILIQAALILYILKKFKITTRCLIILSTLLFIIGYIIEYNILLRYEMDEYLVVSYRNSLFIGFPFLALGYLTAQYKSKILSIRLRNIVCALILAICLFLCEIYMGYLNHWVMDFYASLFIVCPLLFFIIIRYPKYPSNYFGIVGSLSAAVYYVHLIVVFLLINLTGHSESYFRCFLVFFLSLLLAYTIVQVNKSIKIFL